MHESLKRPLFRKKAMEVYRAKQGGKVPGYVAGAFIAPIMAGARFVAPYAARAIGGTTRGIMSAKTGLEQFAARPGVAKGLLGLETASALAGGEEVRRAAMGEESLISEGPATYSGGLAALYGGVGTAGRSLKAAFPGRPMAQQVGSKLSLPAPFIIPVGGALVSMGEPEVRGTYQKESQIRGFKDQKEYETKMEGISKQFEKLPKNASNLDYVNVIESYDLTNQQKEAIYTDVFKVPKEMIPNLRQELKTTQGAPKEPKESLGLTDSTKDVEQNFAGEIPTGKPSNMTPRAQDKAAINLVNKQNNATNTIKQIEESKSNDDAWKREYSKIRESIQSVTGSGDMTNLILLQLAAGLLTGKTTQGGLSGFADVLGQATKPAVETAIFLASKQKEFDSELALALMKRQEKGDTAKIESQRVMVLENDPSDPFFPTKSVEKGVSSASGRLLDINKGPGGESFTPSETRSRAVKVDEKRRTQAEIQMDNQAIAINLSKIVLNSSDSFKGAGGALKDAVNTFVGATQSLFNVTNISEFDAKTFALIRDEINNPELFSDNQFASVKEKETAIKQRDEIFNKFLDEDSKIKKNLQKAIASGDAEKEAFAALEFVENRAKYVVANANKAQDRLALKDIVEAEKNTRIKSLRLDPEKVNANYKQLIVDMNNRFRNSARTYVNNGGTTDDLLVNYNQVPFMQQYADFQQKRAAKQIYGEQKNTKQTQSKKRDVTLDLENFDNLK